ncbi:MAG: DUF898 family protein [Pseudomonadota bacterium]
MKGSAAMADPKTAKIAFDGALGPMFRLFFVNLALTIVTLGIYSFWAKTRVRRYLLSHTELLGDRLEYTGTGGELFRGFVFAVLGVFLPAALIVAAFQIGVGPTAGAIAQGVVVLAFLMLIPLAQFTGARYRLSRTQWRGVRFALDGSPVVYALKAFVQRIIVIATLGIATPQAVLALERYRLDRIAFGDLRGRLNAHWREAPWLSWILPLAVTIALIGLYIGGVVFALAQAGTVETSPEAQSLMLRLMLDYGEVLQYLPFLVIGLIILAPILFVWHQARFIRFLCTRWGLRGAERDRWVAIYPPQSPGAYVRLLIGNYLIILFTFGLGAPIVWRRSMRFLTRFILVNAETMEDAAQSALSKPRQGEGLLSGFDVGVV